MKKITFIYHPRHIKGVEALLVLISNTVELNFFQTPKYYIFPLADACPSSEECLTLILGIFKTKISFSALPCPGHIYICERLINFEDHAKTVLEQKNKLNDFSIINFGKYC